MGVPGSHQDGGALPRGRRIASGPGSSGPQLFLEVLAKKAERVWLTCVLLHFGHLIFFFSRSAKDRARSNSFLHFLHTKSYIGISMPSFFPTDKSSKRHFVAYYTAMVVEWNEF